MSENGPGERNVLVVVEDDPDFLVLIGVTLASDPRLHLTGEAPTVESAIALARDVKPDLIILDHNLEGRMEGISAAPRLKAAAPDVKILLFSSYDLSAEARREPAIDAYVRKDDVHKLLPTARRLLGFS